MKNILKCLAFTLVTVLTISYVLSVLSLKDTSGAEEDRYSAYEQLYNSDRNTMDVVFVGTSHCYNSVYPALIWHEFGIASFDMAISAQSRNSTYHSLKEVLKTQHPSVVFVEMYGLTDLEAEEEGNFYRNNVTMRFSKNMIDLVREEGREDAKDCLLKWPIVHTRYRELTKDDFDNKGINSYGRGSEMRMGEPGGFVNNEKAASTETEPISPENKAWIDRLYELSQKENFELVLFLAPYSLIDDGRKISNGAKEYAASKGITYLDMTDPEVLEEMAYDPAVDQMNDFHHNTIYGAIKISRYLGNYIKDNYPMTDRRGDGKYARWDKDYDLLKHICAAHALYDSHGNEAYLESVSGLEDCTILLSLDGYFFEIEEYMDMFGISKEEYEGGGKWIYRNGKAEKLMTNSSEEVRFVPLGRYDGLRVKNADNPYLNVYFDLEPVIQVDDGLNVLVYDDLREKVISVRGVD